jgi:ribonuclease III
MRNICARVKVVWQDMDAEKENPTVTTPDFEGLSEKIGYSFRNRHLLVQAFSHSSYVNEQNNPELKDNERLEFLGDAVLDLGISHILMDRFKNASEGELSKFRAMMVDESGLSQVASTLGLSEYLLLGKGEEQTRGREKPSILADTMESVIGAIYLDGGFEKSLQMIERTFAHLLEKVGSYELHSDFKSLLQEFTQQTIKTLPRYQIVEESGQAHKKTFRVALLLNGEKISEGAGSSKKEAEQNAAREAFFCLKES